MMAAVPLFFLSGCAALIYEVVWFQLLQLIIGSSAVSLSLLLGTFMGGLFIGSWLAPPRIPPRMHPMRVFAMLELTVAAMGLALLFGLPLIDHLYRGLGGHIGIRMAIACVCLLPPTIAMGATLPVVARATEASPEGTAWLGYFYAANIAGGVAGTLTAGFYLLRVFDVQVATFSAAVLNVVVAVSAWMLGRKMTVPDPAPSPVADSSSPAASDSILVYIAIALSGMTALSAEVTWTRLLALNFGATVYSFSLILAAFLIGLGGGGTIGAWLGSRGRPRPRVALGWTQFLLCAAVWCGGWLLTKVFPGWQLTDSVRRNAWLLFRADLFRALLAVEPASLLWGASFTLALASITDAGQDRARIAGGVYAANTAGAIFGALGTSLLLGLGLGSQHVQQLLIGIAAAAGLIALMSALPASRAGISTFQWICAAAVVTLFIPIVPLVPDALIGYGRDAAEWIQTSRYADAGKFLYTGEGLSEYVAVSQGPAGELNFHAAGKVQASTLPEDMRLQLLLGHLSHLVPSEPANVLVIGCGAGITAGAVSLAPGVREITIAEIEPLVFQAAEKYFGGYNEQVLRQPGVVRRIDDGRHVLAASPVKFDVITTDLTDPWVKGVAALFTRKFFELAKSRLRAGGVVTQFVQLYQSSPDAVKSEIATFVDAFPNSVIWGNPNKGQGYDLVLLGQVEPVRIDVEDIEARLLSPRYAAVAGSLRRIGIGSAVELLSTFTATGADLKPWLRGAAINRDRDLRLEYLAGLGLNLDENGPIYREMLRHAAFHPELFAGPASDIAALRQAFGRNAAR